MMEPRNLKVNQKKKYLSIVKFNKKGVSIETPFLFI